MSWLRYITGGGTPTYDFHTVTGTQKGATRGTILQTLEDACSRGASEEYGPLIHAMSEIHGIIHLNPHLLKAEEKPLGPAPDKLEWVYRKVLGILERSGAEEQAEDLAGALKNLQAEAKSDPESFLKRPPFKSGWRGKDGNFHTVGGAVYLPDQYTVFNLQLGNGMTYRSGHQLMMDPQGSIMTFLDSAQPERHPDSLAQRIAAQGPQRRGAHPEV